MRKLAAILFGCILLLAGAPAPTQAQKKSAPIEQEKREEAIRRKEARKAEEEEVSEKALRTKIQKIRKARAIAVERKEDTGDLDEQLEELKSEVDSSGD